MFRWLAPWEMVWQTRELTCKANDLLEKKKSESIMDENNRKNVKNVKNDENSEKEASEASEANEESVVSDEVGVGERIEKEKYGPIYELDDFRQGLSIDWHVCANDVEEVKRGGRGRKKERERNGGKGNEGSENGKR